MKRKFGFIFTFTFFDDTIIYKTLRFCSDLESAKAYATTWVEKFGEKYGRCLYCEIRENAVPVFTIIF